MYEARVAGVGHTDYGKTPDRTGRDLFGEAGVAALDDADVPREDVEHVLFGNFMGELAEGQGHMGPLAADAVGVTAPATRVESACASSGAAVHRAVMEVRAGQSDVVLAGGAERMTSLDTGEATRALAIAADALYEVRAGMTFPAAYALMASAYFETFGGDRTDLAHVAVKNHANAMANPHAQFHRELDVEDVLGAPVVADPIGLYDACPITDGASALVVVSDEYAAEHDVDAPVTVSGSGQGADHLALQSRASMASTPAAERAAADAYAEAGVEADDVDFAEVHDCFTIAEVLALEALGFYGPGEAAGAARRGETTADGDLPVNLSGGLKAKGHPVGATGAGQVGEVAQLLAGTHPNADAVPDARVGVAHNAGGTLASATVHVLEVAE